MPAAGILSLQTYENELLRYQERSMVQQGRVLAAALGDAGPLDAEIARAVLLRMDGGFDSRLRVIDANFELLTDSATLDRTLSPPDERPEANQPSASARLVEPPALEPSGTERAIRAEPIYRIGNLLYQTVRRFSLPPEPPRPSGEFYSTQSKLIGAEIETALRGAYGSATRRTVGTQRSLTLYSALPVRSGDAVVGAVLVSRSTYQILASLYELRLATFEVVLLSVLAAVVLSLLLSATIARPLRRLSREAHALVDRRGRLTGDFGSTGRGDEIGDLARSLQELTRRLRTHLDFTERFAADVSHELKNPLAAVRNATEVLAEVNDPAERQRFQDMIHRDLARLERLLAGVREVTLVDTALDLVRFETVDLAPLLEQLVESYRLRHPRLRFELETLDGADSSAPLQVIAPTDRLVQVLENLLDNAASFSPDDASVTLRLRRHEDSAEITVADRGPGIPPEHLERIFDRFFSWRPDDPTARTEHTGLGLAIARGVVDHLGGQLTATARAGGGARFRLAIPLAPD